MKVVIQHQHTLAYWTEQNTWTKNLSDAKTFVTSAEAILFCVKKAITPCQVLLKFDSEAYDVKLTLSEEEQPQQFHDQKQKSETVNR